MSTGIDDRVTCFKSWLFICMRWVCACSFVSRVGRGLTHSCRYALPHESTLPIYPPGDQGLPCMASPLLTCAWCNFAHGPSLNMPDMQHRDPCAMCTSL